MTTLKIHDKYFVPFIGEHELSTQVKKIGERISEDYEGKRPLFISILNGSFMFAAELFKSITIDAEICFIKLASYKGTKSTGQVITAIGLDMDIKDRHIVILEDIVDTGKTLSYFIPQIMNQQPASLKVAVLLHKPDAAIHKIDIGYCCFTIADKFVVGFGLDYNGLGRNIPSIYQLQ